ncbi:MAG: phosphomannomutase/phosphoglucomutase [bacterium]
MAGIFKAYDIRGIYGKTLTDDMAFRIGRAFATFLHCRKVVVGRDMRPHSKPLFEALARGLTMQGADVIDIGLCSTPMSYYSNGSLEADGSIMITASHNPGEWNGFKLCRAKAVPISGLTGIPEIERLVNENAFAPVAAQPGRVTTYDVVPDYLAHIRRSAHLDMPRPVQIAVDFANGMGIYEAKVLEGLIGMTRLFDTLDGTFPNHEANPLKLETLATLCQTVKAGHFDFGVAFDGDADRAGFVDETGAIVPMDMITALIASSILQHQKGVIYYDLRSSWTVKEVITENGGCPMMSRVGHAFIKQQMRESNAVFAGELSGHYYFRDNFFTESAALAVLYVANIVTHSGKTLSQLIKPFQRYFASGEINSEVEDSQAVLAQLRAKYTGGRAFELDGLSVEYPDWWFNVRCSNTEPLVRLNIEAKTEAAMRVRRDELLAIIRAKRTSGN